MTGCVLWITGLSGSGKSSLAGEIVLRLKNSDLDPILIDGDTMREVFGTVIRAPGDYSREGRIEFGLTYARLAKMLADQGFVTVVATISMFEEVYLWNRKNQNNYFEIFLDLPLVVLQRRDSKQVYSRFASQELKEVAGLDLKIDRPLYPDLILSEEKFSIPREAKRIISEILQKFHL